MTLRKPYKDLNIDIVNETFHDQKSDDKIRQYQIIYSDGEYEDYLFVTKHGIVISKNGEEINSACLISSGGTTGVHETCAVIDKDKLLVCCADSIFCLNLVELELIWKTRADSATCFEIFKHKEDYIVHGELEISKLDRDGNLIWQFGGADIFTTTSGHDTFELRETTIKAKDWTEATYEIDIETGRLLRKYSF